MFPRSALATNHLCTDFSSIAHKKVWSGLSQNQMNRCGHHFCLSDCLFVCLFFMIIFVFFVGLEDIVSFHSFDFQRSYYYDSIRKQVFIRFVFHWQTFILCCMFRNFGSSHLPPHFCLQWVARSKLDNLLYFSSLMGPKFV